MLAPRGAGREDLPRLHMREGFYIPIAGGVNLVQVFATFLAEVLVWRRLFRENADTGAVLPDFADIALHEETRNLVRQLDACEEVCFGVVLAMLEVVFEGRGTRVFVKTADAADGLVVLLDVIVVDHTVRIRADLIADFVLAAGASSGW